MADPITLPRIQKPSTVRANWLSQRPWWSAPYYRCPRNRPAFAYHLPDATRRFKFVGDDYMTGYFPHDPDMACCWDAAWNNQIAATRKE